MSSVSSTLICFTLGWRSCSPANARSRFVIFSPRATPSRTAVSACASLAGSSELDFGNVQAAGHHAQYVSEIMSDAARHLAQCGDAPRRASAAFGLHGQLPACMDTHPCSRRWCRSQCAPDGSSSCPISSSGARISGRLSATISRWGVTVYNANGYNCSFVAKKLSYSVALPREDGWDSRWCGDLEHARLNGLHD